MFGFFRNNNSADINTAVEQLKQDRSARLIDVRTPEEYRSGHIQGSLSVPLDRAESIEKLIPDKSTRLLVYCRSGGRSAQALSLFRRLGYENAENIGGILGWKGPLSR